MTKEEIHSALSSRDRWLVLSTIGSDGFPHSVPVGCSLLDDRLIIGCRDGSQKIRNIERDSRVSILWENGRGASELRGILIRGKARIVRDAGELLALRAKVRQRRGEEPPRQPPPQGTVYLEITPVKTVSWERPSRASEPTDPNG